MSAPAAVETGLFLEGLRCAGCVSRVERELRTLPGVERASINYTTHRALLRLDPQRVGIDQVLQRVRALGYDGQPFDPVALDRPAARSARAALVRVLVAGFLAGNVMLISVALYVGEYQGIEPEIRRGLRWLAVALSLPAVTWCAVPFWRGALAGLRRREIGMDVPIVIAFATAFAASVSGTVAEARGVFMDSAAMMVFLILLGRTLERAARARASGAVERLAALSPRTALRRTRDGIETVATTALASGDRVVVPPGASFPVDGRIVEGRTEVDEALLTGESLPLLRETGELVTGGTRNVLCEVEIEVTASAGEGTLARMAELLERAEAERPRIQRTADRVARVFAPAVLAVAALTAIVWGLAGVPAREVAFTVAAVLIVACPCALGLATPAAVSAAIGRAASLGILFKSAEAIERCATVDYALLDKTGTVTEGRLAVEAVRAAAGVRVEEVLAVALAVEGCSSHPVAHAIRGEAERKRIQPAFEPTERRAVAGRGVVATTPGERWMVGSPAWIASSGIECPAELAAASRTLGAGGATLACVADRKRALGVIALLDPTRRDAAVAVAHLERMGVGVELVSGDHAPAVGLAAVRAGITRWRAGVSPDEKVEAVRLARRVGHRVLVAGDGINDAAALAAADVGIAMSRGADVALDAADLVVRSRQLATVPQAVRLCRAALRRIRENLGFAVAYNAVAIPFAAAGWLEPVHAAVAMSLSSLVVTGNAVRLLRWKFEP